MFPHLLWFGCAVAVVTTLYPVGGWITSCNGPDWDQVKKRGCLVQDTRPDLCNRVS